MRRSYDNPDDYAYDYAHAADCGCMDCNPGYLHNPAATGSREEAESQRVMAIVQYVLDLANDNADYTYEVFRFARKQNKIKQLVALAIAAIEPYHSLTKREKEALLAGLSDPDSVDVFSVDKVYYVDELAAEDLLGGGTLTGQDPGVLVTKTAYTGFSLGTTRGDGRRRRRRARRDRRRKRPFQKTFLREVWPYVRDNDVKNAVRILQQQGITFLRKHLMSLKAWKALGDNNAKIARFAPATIRSREEFLSAYATAELGDVVLRLNLGAVLKALAKFDFAPDDVVYQYSGAADSIGGASAKGFYVARLRPSQLTLEGMSPPVGLGICVGGDSYRNDVESGRMQIYGIRTPGGKPKFTLSVRLEKDQEDEPVFFGDARDYENAGAEALTAAGKPVAPFFDVSQVKGKANRLPGFDPESEVFKGEAGVDDVRVVVEFLAGYLGMTAEQGQREDRKPPRGMPYAPQAINDIWDLQAGLLAMQRIGIDPFSPPVKGQTWDKVSAEREAKRQALRGLGSALDEMRAAQRPLGVGEQAALPPAVWPPAENPDPLAYTDPDVAALARAAYAQPMGGRWTYEDDVEDEGEGGE